MGEASSLDDSISPVLRIQGELRLMRIAVFGAGAIGGYVAARLAAKDAGDISVVARGDHLAAIRDHGLRIRSAEGDLVARLRASDDAAALGPQDYVLLALKAHSVAPALPAILPLLGPETAVVTLQNGIPWWYFHRSGGPYEGRRIESVDPGGAIAGSIGAARAIGSVIYLAGEVEAPGVIHHGFGSRIILGEPCGETTPRIRRLASALESAGFIAPVSAEIRTEIWLKLWGNVAFNPISTLTGSTLTELVTDAETRAAVKAVMREAERVAAALGVRMPIDADTRIERAAAVGGHRTSMLQDLALGRPLEIDALVTAVQELGRLTATPTPTLDMVLAIVRRLAIARGCYSSSSSRMRP